MQIPRFSDTGFRLLLRTGSISLLLALLAIATAVAESPNQLSIGDVDRRDFDLEVEVDQIVDARRGDVLTPGELAKRLARTRLLLVGEAHTSEEFHRVQQMVLRELERSGRRVIVGLEMLPREENRMLDLWTRGHLTEDGFLEAADWYAHWGYNWEYYRPIFELARSRHMTMRGLNVPRALVRQVRTDGFDSLDDEERALLTPEIQPATEEFSRLFMSYFDESSGMHGLEGEVLTSFLNAQMAWDSSMAQSALEVLEAEPKAIMVVLVGSGHVAYGLGVARQAAPWLDGEIRTLIPVVVDDEDESPGRVSASYADFVWGVATEVWPRFPALGMSTRLQDAGERSVIFVDPEGAAAAAGLASGDVLVAVDGQSLEGDGTVRRIMADKRWGDVVELQWRRDSAEMKAIAHLQRRSSGEDEAEE